MHEVGLMQEALTIALDHAQRSGAAHVHALTMRVGPLAGVDVGTLRLAFDVVKSDTAAEGAALNLEETAVACWCGECERLFQPADSIYRCPLCECLSHDIRQGREFDLVAVEIS